MAKGMEGKRIVISGSRKTEEMTALIEKQGGIPLVHPLQGTVFPSEQELDPVLRQLVEKGTDWFILTTSLGVEAMLKAAERMGLEKALLDLLGKSQKAVRGYKTAALLKSLGMEAEAVDDDGTTAGLIRSLEPYDLSGRRMAVQLHGDTAPKLIQYLADKGAVCQEILPYRHTPPEHAVLETLCSEILAGEVDAVTFTTALQVRNLFRFAGETGVLEPLLASFEGHTVAAAVGKITAEALREEGVGRILSPEHERMGAMIITLSRYFSTAEA